jgi:hypothetical protein
MDEKQQRLVQLQAAMTANERATPPSDEEAAAWVIVYVDLDGQDGRPTQRTAKWLPKSEFDEWQRIRFGPKETCGAHHPDPDRVGRRKPASD